MITKELLIKGYHAGIVKLVEGPNCGGTMCKIGERLFYFDGLTAEELSSEECKNDIPEEDILMEILDALSGYKAVLNDYPYKKKEQEPLLESISDEALVKELLRRKVKVDNSSVNQILENSGYLEWKLWTSEDIMTVMESLGYIRSEESLASVINTGYLKALRECTDQDWFAIEGAIKKAVL